MRPDDPNYEYLLLIADALGDLRYDVMLENRLPAAGFVRDVNSDVICSGKH